MFLLDLFKKKTPAAEPAVEEQDKMNLPAAEPQGCTVISFTGIRRGDLIYYLSKLLATCDAPVLIVDNSSVHDTFRSVQHQGEKAAYFKNVTVIANAAYNESFEHIFRYIIVYHEFNISKKWWDNSDFCYMVTDFDRFNMQKIIHLFELINQSGSEKVMTLVITGRYSGSFSDRFLAESLNITNDFVEEALEIPQDDETMAMWLSFQNSGIAQPGKVNRDYQKTLWSIYQKVTGSDNKTKMSYIFNKAN